MPQAWTTSTGSTRRLLSVAIAALLALSGLVLVPGTAQAALNVAPADNPAWPSKCDVDIVIVFDRSNSIGDAGAGNDMENAGQAFVNALAETPAEIAVTQFRGITESGGSGVGGTVIGWTSVATPAGVTNVNNAIEALTWPSSGNQGGTNWEHGFNTTDPFASKADIILFLTDGNPTTRNGATDLGSVVDDADIDAGVTEANNAKAAGSGTRVVGVGIGNGIDTDNLIRISGPVADDDYFLSSFGDLADELGDIVEEFCRPLIEIEKATNGEDADAAPGPSIPFGDPVKWTYTVTNTGPVTLYNIAAADDQEGAITCPETTLGAGESMDCTAKDGFAIEGLYTNEASVSGDTEDDGGDTVTDTDPSHYTGGDEPDPSIDIEKWTNGEDADVAPGPSIPVGDPVDWTYKVTNTGNVTLDDIEVTDDQGVTVACPTDTLEPAEAMTCTGNGLATVGEYKNTGTASGQPPEGSPVSDEDPSHYTGYIPDAPDIEIDKLTNGSDGPNIPVGDPVAWTYKVTNTGNVALYDIEVTDDQGVTVTCPATTLPPLGDAPANEMTCTANGTAVEGPYSNLGTVVGDTLEGDGGDKVSDEDPSNYTGYIPDAPDIDIEKSTNGEDADDPTGPQVFVGSTVTWQYVVDNTGNIPLYNISVTDDQAGVNPAYVSGDTGNDGVLGVDEVWIYEASGAATLGQYANTGTVTADDDPDEGDEFTDSDDSHYLGVRRPVDPQGSLAIEKKVWDGDSYEDSATLASGAVPTWQIKVSNSGPVTVSGISLSDKVNGVVAPACETAFATALPGKSLGVGGSVIFTCASTAVGFGQTTNVAVASGSGVPSVTADAVVTVKILQVLASGVIGDRVWYDLDDDGVQDASEVGIAGSTVRITGLDGQDVDPVTAGIQTSMTMLTGNDGKYLFSGLPAGNYKVDTQLSWIPDPEAVGLRFTTPSSFTIALPDGGENLTADFGVISDELAHTGLNTDTLLIVAIMLMIAGAGAVLVTRRRKDNGEDLAA